MRSSGQTECGWRREPSFACLHGSDSGRAVRIAPIIDNLSTSMIVAQLSTMNGKLIVPDSRHVRVAPPSGATPQRKRLLGELLAVWGKKRGAGARKLENGGLAPLHGAEI
jgi:hypothetical protein